MTSFALPFNLYPAKSQYFDDNGDPLALGTVSFYIPATLTPKQTYSDYTLVTPNAIPTVTLDAAGRASIYGSGLFRQIVKNAAGATIYDQVVGFADVTLPAIPGTLVGVQAFTASGTYTRSPNVTAVLVFVTGGGGGGGGSQDASASGGAGGGGGGTVIEYITAGLGATETVTIGAAGTAGSAAGGNGGAGGTSSFGAHCSATGGGGGIGSATAVIVGGAGGVGSGGTLNLGGGVGGPGVSAGGGNGGASFWGANGGGGQDSAGGAAGNYGGGGGGGDDGAGAGAAGAVGTAGAILVLEFVG